MGQSVEEGMKDIEASASAALQLNVEKFAEVGNQVIAKIDGAFEAFSAHAQQLNELAGHNVVAMETLFRRIEAIDTSPELIARKLDPLIENFRAMLTESEARATAQKTEFNRITKAANTSQTAIEKLDAAVQSIEANMRGGSDRLRTEMTQAAEAVTSVRAVMVSLVETARSNASAMGQSAQALGQTLNSDLVAIQKRRADLQAEVDAAHALVVSVHASLASLARMVTETVSAER
jgi:chromosome segregation ATPase